jgi:hypothetical protein
MRLATVLLIVGLSLGSSGCWFEKKTPAAPPPPAPQPKQAPPVQPPAPKLPEQKPLPMPPPTEIKEPEQIPLPAPQKIAPRRPAQKKRIPPPAPPPPPQPAEQPAAQQPAPQLGVILSDAERRQYEAEYTQSLSRARWALQQVSGKSLSSTQREAVERIKTFIQQAEESRGKDLATALQLVKRADLLGQDLLKDLQ